MSLQYNVGILNSLLTWRKSVFFNASLCAFLNVAAPFVYCIFWPFGSIIFNSLSRLIYINVSLNDKHSCQRFNTTLTKIDEIPIFLVNLSIIFLLFCPFQWRYLQVLGDAVHYETLWQRVLTCSCNAFNIS